MTPCVPLSALDPQVLAVPWQDYQRHSPHRQAQLRHITLCELASIDTGPDADRWLWPVVYRELTALRLACAHPR